jgi:MFS family permease
MSATYATAAPVFPTASEEAAGLDGRRWRALPVILIGSFLAFLDFFIVNIALPAMQIDLGARPAQLQLVVAAYGIGFGVFLITGGRLGDIFGRKRVFLLGITGFTLASRAARRRRQMTLRDCCISLNTPDAVITSVTIPVAAARKPAELPAALQMAVWSHR